MHKILLSIGTNTDACLNMSKAKELLRSCFSTIKFTDAIETAPYGEKFTTPFFNSLAYFEADVNKNGVVRQLKEIEKKMGRKPSHKSEGIVIIDIDLLQWNSEVLKPDDLERSFMPELLLELNKIISCL